MRGFIALAVLTSASDVMTEQNDETRRGAPAVAKALMSWFRWGRSVEGRRLARVLSLELSLEL